MIIITDIIIIGGGPAGTSAALTAKNRGKSVKIISNPAQESNLWKAHLVENYPGLSSVTGAELLTSFRKQLQDGGIEVLSARALNAMQLGESFSVSVGQDYYDCRSIILTVGITQQALYKGEAELLGRGVSYCATCDGMLYRQKNVAVIGLNEEAPNEAEFLRSIGCNVEYFDRNRAKKYEILGEERVSALVADDVQYPVDGIFILRSTIAPSSFLPGLDTQDGHIVTDEKLQTSVKGVFAAGDCVGRPYQVARAVGQGNTAALSACDYLDKK